METDIFRGRIIAIEDGKNSYEKDTLSKFHGQNGDYPQHEGDECGLLIKIYNYETIRIISFDVKELLLDSINKQRLSTKMIETLRLNNIGKEIELNKNEPKLINILDLKDLF